MRGDLAFVRQEMAWCSLGKGTVIIAGAEYVGTMTTVKFNTQGFITWVYALLGESILRAC